MNNKLDPGLRSLLMAQRERSASTQEAAPKEAPAKRVELIVEYTGELADLTAVGFEPRSVMEHPREGYRIATGTILVEQLEELAAIDHVVEAEGPQQYHPLLDYSLPEIHAVTVHNGTPSRKGHGVVIGVIDSGVDWRHGDFVNQADHTSRILAIWDQMLTAGNGETAGLGGIGVQYTKDQLTQGLNGTLNVRTRDNNKRNETNGHGTHVTGIAAGNGAVASCCTTSGTYVGVAPEAEIIVVRYDYSAELGANVRIVDALNYIFNHTAAAGKPVVVNISQGINRGPHDGTSMVERSIDAQVATGPGRVIVVAAGNFADTRCHVKGVVTNAAPLEIEFSIRENFESTSYLDLWYDRAGMLNLEVIADGNISSGTVNHGSNHPFVANPTAANNHKVNVEIHGTINGQHNRDNNFRITINKPASGNIPKGDWKLKLTNPHAGAVSFHCWIERGDNAPVFLPAINTPDGKVRASSDSTLSTPSTAAEAITVANHASRTDCCDCWPSTGIVPSSSRGPVARVAAVIKKPDIAAPGLEITSAKADAANLVGNCWSCCPDACCCLYQDMTGTSMAAPHVAGAIALMLEEKPTLTKAEILQHLQNSARERPAGGRDDTFGAGKLDVQAAINAIRNTGGGGGGGGGGPHPFMPIMDGDLIGLPSLLRTDRPSGRRRSPHSETSLSSSDSRQLPPAIRILRARMNAIPNGGSVVAAVSRHFSEVRRLINTNRRVATMWHRSDGPRMMRRLVRGALDSDAPSAFLTESQRVYFHRMFDLLARYGSPRLQKSIEQYRDMIFVLLETPLASQIVTEMAGSNA